MFACLVILSVALLFSLRLIWKQNKLLSTLHEAIKAGQVHLRSEGASEVLPAWQPLIESINTLITENNRLAQQSTDKLAQLEATLGNLR